MRPFGIEQVNAPITGFVVPNPRLACDLVKVFHVARIICNLMRSISFFLQLDDSTDLHCHRTPLDSDSRIISRSIVYNKFSARLDDIPFQWFARALVEAHFGAIQGPEKWRVPINDDETSKRERRL